MKINLVDLRKQYKKIKPEIDNAIQNVINNTDFILGKDVELFEKEFARFCGVKYCVGLDNGSSALELGMHALGIGDGDEVITPANSFIASSSNISFTGARPVLVDCDPKTYNINPDAIESAVTKKAKAIMPVHLYGQPANMDRILEIAKKYKLFVIEDACQAHGADFKGKMIGSFGNFAAFSFYPGKNLGAYGDGGALTTNSKEIYENIQMMRNYGQKEKYHHLALAWNRRLDTIQAAVLLVKLKYLKKWNMARKKIAFLYNKFLEDLPVETPKIDDNVNHVFHLYVIRTKKRDDLANFLKEKGVNTGIHYPIPIHLQKAYKNLGYKRGDFPITEKYSSEVLSLPMYPELTDEEVYYIARRITEFFHQ
jgi:dTDP-4-amino-4,6-dideoxygalactose transaminase